MTSRTAEVYTFGQSMGFADLEVLPKGIVGYLDPASVAHVAGITTETDIQSVSTTLGVNRMVSVTCTAAMAVTGGSGAQVFVMKFYVGATLIDAIPICIPDVGLQDARTLTVLRGLSGGAYTFSTSLTRAAGGGSIEQVAGVGGLIVRDEGPAF